MDTLIVMSNYSKTWIAATVFADPNRFVALGQSPVIPPMPADLVRPAADDRQDLPGNFPYPRMPWDVDGKDLVVEEFVVAAPSDKPARGLDMVLAKHRHFVEGREESPHHAGTTTSHSG
jgi:hypothetical protein